MASCMQLEVNLQRNSEIVRVSKKSRSQYRNPRELDIKMKRVATKALTNIGFYGIIRHL